MARTAHISKNFLWSKRCSSKVSLCLTFLVCSLAHLCYTRGFVSVWLLACSWILIRLSSLCWEANIRFLCWSTDELGNTYTDQTNTRSCNYIRIKSKVDRSYDQVSPGPAVVLLSILLQCVCSVIGAFFRYPVFSSPEQGSWWAIVITPYVVRPSTPSNDFSSVTSWPIFLNLHVEPLKGDWKFVQMVTVI